MAVTVASLQAVLSLVKTNFDKGLKDSQKELTNFQKAQGGVNSVLQEFGVQLGAGVAVVGFTAEMGKMVQMGSAAEESFSKFNNIFGDFATTTRTELDGFAAAVGRNKFELRDFAAGFGALVTGMGMGGQEAGAFSVQLTKLTTDLSSFHNVAEKDVAEALRAGIIGETEPLRKFGVVINQAAVNAELLRMGIEGGAKAATQAEVAQARLNLILAATQTAQNDAAETSGSFANQMRALQAAIAEAETEIGQGLLPVVTPLIKDLTVAAREILPQVVAGFKQMSVLGTGIDSLGKSITALGVALGITDQVTGQTSGTWGIFKALVDASLAPLTGLGYALQGISAALTAIGGFVATLTGRWQQFNAALQQTANTLPALANITANSPVPMAEGLKAIAQQINNMPPLSAAFGGGGMVPMAAGGGSSSTTNINLGGQSFSFSGNNAQDQALIAMIQYLRGLLNQ